MAPRRARDASSRSDVARREANETSWKSTGISLLRIRLSLQRLGASGRLERRMGEQPFGL
jgi:hypothetical protein